MNQKYFFIICLYQGRDTGTTFVDLFYLRLPFGTLWIKTEKLKLIQVTTAQLLRGSGVIWKFEGIQTK